MIAGTSMQVSARPELERLGYSLLFVAAAVFAAVVLWHFHDRFWWPPDEGAYAHVADRILAGEVLNRDVQDIHAGYVNFANAAALWVFGHDLLSLRYPLAVMAFIGSCLVFLLLLPRGGLIALAGAVAYTSLSFVQFLNPTAHWYSLFILVLLVCALTWLPASFPLRLEVLGFLVILLMLFRQLSGVFVALGVIAYLLTENRDVHAGSSGRAGRALIAVMGAGLACYLLAKADLVTLVMFGVWPLLALAWAWSKTRTDAGQLVHLGARMGCGGAVAAAPLIIYHLANGSVGPWLEDTVLAAFGLTNLEFMNAPSFAVLPLLGLRGVLAPGTAAELINGAFWLLVFFLPLLLGALTTSALWRERRPGYPLPFLALFYGLVSVHYQIPIYLFYTIGITVAGILWFVAVWNGFCRFLAPAIAVLLSTTALYYQAAQPVSRGIAGMVEGDRIQLLPERWGSRVGLHVDHAGAALYDDLIAVVEARVPPDQKILALPFNPELYFLTGRDNPFRFTNSALGIRSEDDLADALATLTHEPPRMVFYRPDDKYNTPISRPLIDYIRQRYERVEGFDGFEIYQLPEQTRSGGGSGPRRGPLAPAAMGGA
jgi:hypothetical protein